MTSARVVQLPSPQQEPRTPEGVNQAEIEHLLTDCNRLDQLRERVERE